MRKSETGTNSLAHLLALRQLTLPKSRYEGVMLNNDLETGHLLTSYFGSAIKALGSYDELAAWPTRQGYCTSYTSFYLAGNQSL